MQKITGIGGVFFKSRDKELLLAWYRDNLGMPVQEWGGAVIQWNDDPHPEPSTVWSPFKDDTTYFEPGTATFMINFRVTDLHKMLAQLRTKQ